MSPAQIKELKDETIRLNIRRAVKSLSLDNQVVRHRRMHCAWFSKAELVT